MKYPLIFKCHGYCTYLSVLVEEYNGGKTFVSGWFSEVHRNITCTGVLRSEKRPTFLFATKSEKRRVRWEKLTCVAIVWYVEGGFTSYLWYYAYICIHRNGFRDGNRMTYIRVIPLAKRSNAYRVSPPLWHDTRSLRVRRIFRMAG